MKRTQIMPIEMLNILSERNFLVSELKSPINTIYICFNMIEGHHCVYVKNITNYLTSFICWLHIVMENNLEMLAVRYVMYLESESLVTV